MKIIKAQKVATTRMVEVTLNELKTLKDKFDWISLGKFDIVNTVNNTVSNTVSNTDKDNIIGYLAGDIDYLFHDNVQEPKDVWFINKDFFKENYIKLEEK